MPNEQEEIASDDKGMINEKLSSDSVKRGKNHIAGAGGILGSGQHLPQTDESANVNNLGGLGGPGGGHAGHSAPFGPGGHGSGGGGGLGGLANQFLGGGGGGGGGHGGQQGGGNFGSLAQQAGQFLSSSGGHLTSEKVRQDKR